MEVTDLGPQPLRAPSLPFRVGPACSSFFPSSASPPMIPVPMVTTESSLAAYSVETMSPAEQPDGTTIVSHPGGLCQSRHHVLSSKIAAEHKDHSRGTPTQLVAARHTLFHSDIGEDGFSIKPDVKQLCLLVACAKQSCSPGSQWATLLPIAVVVLGLNPEQLTIKQLRAYYYSYRTGLVTTTQVSGKLVSAMSPRVSLH